MVTATLTELSIVRVRFVPANEEKGTGPWAGLIFRDSKDNRFQLALTGRDQATAVMVAAARCDTLLAEAGLPAVDENGKGAK
jgi:hypothetical protein